MQAATKTRVDFQPEVTTSDAVGTPLLQQLRVDHGPIGLLGRFFLKAEQAARSRGVELAFASLDELIEVNRQHIESWQPLLPMFEPQPGFGPVPTAFCILGRDRHGKVVATQAARVYNLSKSSLYDEATSLRLFYPALEPEKTAGKTCTISAQIAHSIHGRVTYSGGGWYHPEYRGRELSAILPRISRAYAHTRWHSNTTVSFINTQLVEKGVARRYGYSNVDYEVRLTGMVTGDFRAGIAWMNTPEMLSDLEQFVLGTSTQVDTRSQRRSG